MLRVATFVGLLLAAMACSRNPTHEPKTASPPPSKPTVETDENLWLEEVQGKEALNWVTVQNNKSLKAIQSLSTYRQNESEIRQILFARDRIPPVRWMGGRLYNFWQDEAHVRGLWRRTTVESYKTSDPEWETVLDLDALALSENENWVWKGADCYEPRLEKCLIFLSRGGKDAVVVREFDLNKMSFIADGFYLPEAKTNAAWLNEDALLIATDFGPGSVTKSGYARIAKLWRRGQRLSEARTLVEGLEEDMGVSAATLSAPEGQMSVVFRELNFYESEAFRVSDDGELSRLNKPLDATLQGWFKGKLILQLRADWMVSGQTFKAGSLVALAMGRDVPVQLVFAPTARQSIESVGQVKEALVVSYLDSVQGRVARVLNRGQSWFKEEIPLPGVGSLDLSSTNPFGDEVLLNYRGFLTPTTIFMAHVRGKGQAASVRLTPLKSMPSRFEEGRFEVTQLWATSRDGTQVPYFLVSAKDQKRNGENPVLLYGYGGFEVSETPVYLGLIGKSWMEKGGTYAVANIRGGGEFGPEWHQAAIKENRQKAFDDFIAVAEDLVQRKVTSPNKLAISGGSNGGLLVGATFIQRPDLFKAVLCRVPLLDMLRYNQLLAGASWEGEYGNPADPVMREALLKYSPYQNVKASVKYPEVFFMTSTADDRVHPGHARKMAARMLSQGHDVQYFENTEGGHGGAANLEQSVRMQALSFTFLQDRLFH